MFESQLDVLHLTAPGVPDFVSHPVGASCVHLPKEWVVFNDQEGEIIKTRDKTLLSLLHYQGVGVLVAVAVVAHAVAVVQYIPVFNVIATVCFDGVLLVQSVLKWLQYLLCVKNVMPWHFASSSHDFLHAAMSEVWPDVLPSQFSPWDTSHSLPL